MSLKIHSIPIEVFLDHLLPIIDIKDLLSLACTDRFFAELCADDTFWKRRLKDDMNYSIVDARNKGTYPRIMMHIYDDVDFVIKVSNSSIAGSAGRVYMSGGELSRPGHV